jgi:hypothetical protein
MDIYTIASIAAPFAPGRAMIGLYNGTDSGKVLKVYKILALNNQTVAITGVVTLLEIIRISTGSGGVALPVVKHDTLSPNLPAQVVSSLGMSYTQSDKILRMIWSSDEPLQSGNASIDEWQTIPAGNLLWDSSYSFSEVQPLVLREGQGLAVIQNTVTTSAVGAADFFMEFTAE